MEDIAKGVQPLVSVGICTYNRPDGLRKTLECITSQTYTNLEIIVSQDYHENFDFENIVNDFKDVRIKYYKHLTQLYMNNNFNFVLQKAEGDYFMWAADDDLWESDFIEECVKKFYDDSILLVFPKADLIGSKGEFLCTWDYSSKYLSDIVINMSSFVKNAFTYNLGFYGLYKTKILKDVALLNCFGSDQLLIANILSKGKIESCDKIVFHYRNDGFSVSRESYLKSMGLTKGFSYKYPFLRFIIEYLRISTESPLSIFNKAKLCKTVFVTLLRNPKFRYGIKKDFDNLFKY